MWLGSCYQGLEDLIIAIEKMNATKKPSRILIVSPGYPRWRGDYTHPMVYNVARMLNDEGHLINVVTIHYPGTLTNEDMDGVKVARAKYAPEKLEVLGSAGGLIDDIRGSFLCKLLLLPMLTTLAWKTFKHAKDCDLILVQWVPTAIVALPAKFLLRKPLIFHSRTYPDTFFWRSVYKLLLRFADGVIYNSQDNRLLTELVYPHKRVLVIGSGIDIKQFSRPVNHIRTKFQEWRIITIARLVEFKGLEYAINGIKILKDRGYNIHLEIIGDGPLWSELQAQIEINDISGQVSMIGALPHNEVPTKLWDSDLFLLSSIIDSKGRTEGFGAVILEAMAAGLPVIASSVGGIGDILNGHNGILIKEKSSEAIANAIENLLINSELRKDLSIRGYDFILKKYSDISIYKKYKIFFDQANCDKIIFE